MLQGIKKNVHSRTSNRGQLKNEGDWTKDCIIKMLYQTFKMSSQRVLGQMMDFPLTLHHIFHKNETIWKKKRVVSYIDSSQKPFRYTYAGNNFTWIEL